MVDLRKKVYEVAASLGFGMATDEQLDILILDQILGDDIFQKNSQERIKKFKENGASILVVSHSMTAVEGMCQRVAWLDHGKIMFIGEPKTAIGAYRGGQVM